MRPVISDVQKKQEGSYVKAAFEAMKNATPGLSQEILADELGVTQGLVGQWFSGRTAIPDKRLIRLGGRLGFDPFSLRPSLIAYLLPESISAGRGAEIARILDYCQSASDADFSRFAAVVDALICPKPLAGKP